MLLRHFLKLLKTGNSKGFSLLEVIAALAILSVGITLTAQLIAGGLRSAVVSQKYVMATIYAQSKLGEILIQTKPTETSEAGIFSDDAIDEFRWTSEIVPYINNLDEDDENEWILLYEIKVSVFFTDQGAEKSVNLTTLKTLVVKSDEI